MWRWERTARGNGGSKGAKGEKKSKTKGKKKSKKGAKKNVLIMNEYPDDELDEGGWESMGSGDEEYEYSEGWEDVIVGNMLGDGSFGQVFRGTLDDGTPVVLKRAKERIGSAVDSIELEEILNSRVAEVAAGTCANYLGGFRVPYEAGEQVYNRRMSRGLWLVWEDEGDYTMTSLLDEKDTQLEKLAAAMKLRKSQYSAVSVARAVGKQLFQHLAALHGEGIVHRDVKPENIIVRRDDGKIRLIDLGGAADCLSPGTPGLSPGEGALDPLYAPALDCFLVPDGVVITPGGEKRVWDFNSPEKFDSYCAGVTILQIMVPHLRKRPRLKTFRSQLDELVYPNGNLKAWREEYGSGIDADVAAAMDKAKMWELLESLLAVERDSRPTAKEALAFKFFNT
mmetsp:Transcript_41577/g.132822  ORF Transcript_41577/g.132822 Transcript_41577/m.132822 type:complete len:396 (-) Transcript_41577:2-1189(-)